MLMRRLEPLLSSEDWWNIWLGGLLIAAAVGGIVTRVPGVARWSGPVRGFLPLRPQPGWFFSAAACCS